jgi:hypothetical protein
MKKIVGALIATAITLTAGMAFAENTVSSGRERIRAEWAKSHAVDGYGFPQTAIPRAIARAITGEPDRPPIAQSQDVKAISN